MRVEIKPITNWERVVNAARFTQGLHDLGHEPSDSWKKEALLSEHSPIRLLEFDIRIYDAPYASVMHLVRHFIGVVPFVHTSRPDITGQEISRHEQRKDDPTDVQFSINAQALMAVSRLRLCGKAELSTRLLWAAVLSKMRQVDQIMASAMVPKCVHLNGYCNEKKSCGYVSTNVCKEAIKVYHYIPSKEDEEQ